MRQSSAINVRLCFPLGLIAIRPVVAEAMNFKFEALASRLDLTDLVASSLIFIKVKRLIALFIVGG
jgi:hypothetical protein